jgi:hypothetical protein
VTERRVRDLALLDALDRHRGVSYEGGVWRIVREGRDVLQGYPSRARWDPGTFDVLYTSLAREGALEELHFHLSRQPVFPSKVRFDLHKLSIRTRRTLKLADLEAIAKLGVDMATYGDLDYRRTQEIGDAAAFLGFDGILTPSARWDCLNLTLFTDCFAPDDLAVVESEAVDWDAWRNLRRKLRRF